MHREISHSEKPFYQESNPSLYLLTGLLGILIGLDLWPVAADWFIERGWSLPTWPREFYGGYRIALIAAILGGARVLYSSLEALLEGRLGADLALAIACVAAILFRKPLVAAEVVFIGMVGECLESFTYERTQRAIRGIVEVFPRRCWLLRDGQEVRVLTRELQAGDRVVVKPGGRIPADGCVVDGRSAVDTSVLTGESIPQDKGPGDEVLAGSLNQFGALVIEARKVGEQTVVGQVAELTARALRDKATLERTADRLARYFLPVVLGLAALTFLAGIIIRVSGLAGIKDGLAEAVALSVDPTLAVLVVACPCALILATPAAVLAALGRLAGTGVLIKGGSALERLAQVSAFAFDKTGTLTEGRLELGDRIGLGGVAADDLLRAAAIAEQRSEHLLARLILQEAAERGWQLDAVDDFQAHPGAGVTAHSAGATLVVGTRRLLEEQGIVLSPEALSAAEQLEATGQTTLLVARDGIVLGVLGVRDRLRPEAAGVLAELRSLGIDAVALLTGDRSAVAQSLAERLGIKEVHAELLPQQKAEFIDRWRLNKTASGEPTRVAMVGDGINDAPALAGADVGLAIGGTGAEVAAEAGDVVLMGDPLRPLPLLLRLSRQTVRVIRQNILIFAFAVNGLGIVLTAWLWPLLAPTAAWYEQAPLAGVVYHQLGSLAVLLNSMRLLWFERRSAGPGWPRARQTLRAVDDWLERHGDLHALSHWLIDHARPLAVGILALLILAYALSGLTLIGPDEAAVVRRFGRPLADNLGPGLTWRWPWPIEDVVRLQPDRVRTVVIGQPGIAMRGSSRDSLAWSSTHAGQGGPRDADEAVMITGDGNLVELQATVHYAVDRAQLRTYLFEVRDPEAILRAAAESVVREAVAGQSFLVLLTAGREQFQQDVLARLDERCRQYRPGGLGIRLHGLSLHDVHPPQEVVADYYKVIEAMEARDRQVNEAQAEILQVPEGMTARLPGKRAAQVRKKQIMDQAEAEASATVRAAEADGSRFLARLEARSGLTWTEEGRLLLDALRAIGHGRDARTAYAEYDRRRRERIALEVVLTDFRLFWDTLGQALTGREKMIIDADKVPGRRHLLLMDPEQLRIPVPMLMPERGRQRPLREGPFDDGQ
jgi:Cu+-exporting ATPase